jgi:septum formation protein
MALWLAAEPLVLASRSKARRALLAAAGIPVEARPADLDEKAVAARAGARPPPEVAVLLARAKALEVAHAMPGRLVLGADQMLVLDGQIFSKPADRAAARAQLVALRGRTHVLHSGLAVARDRDVVFACVAEARLTMRAFSDNFIDTYLDTAGAAVTESVGGYQVEGIGIQLFERIDGDHSTILGLPLLPLIAFLRRQGCLA